MLMVNTETINISAIYSPYNLNFNYSNPGY